MKTFSCFVGLLLHSTLLARRYGHIAHVASSAVGPASLLSRRESWTDASQQRRNQAVFLRARQGDVLSAPSSPPLSPADVETAEPDSDPTPPAPPPSPAKEKEFFFPTDENFVVSRSPVLSSPSAHSARPADTPEPQTQQPLIGPFLPASTGSLSGSVAAATAPDFPDFPSPPALPLAAGYEAPASQGPGLPRSSRSASFLPGLVSESGQQQERRHRSFSEALLGGSRLAEVRQRAYPSQGIFPPREPPEEASSLPSLSAADSLLNEVAASKPLLPEGLRGFDMWPPTTTMTDPDMFIPGGSFRLWGARERHSYATDSTTLAAALTLSPPESEKKHFVYPLVFQDRQDESSHATSEATRNLVQEGPLIKVPAGESLTVGELLQYVLTKRCLLAVSRPVFESYGLPLTTFNTRTRSSSSSLPFSSPFAFTNRRRQPQEVPLVEDREPTQSAEEEGRKDEERSLLSPEGPRQPPRSKVDHVELRLPMLSTQRGWLQELFQSMSAKRTDDRLVRGREANEPNMSALPPSSTHDDFTTVQLRPALDPSTVLQALPLWGGESPNGDASADANPPDLFLVHRGKECLDGLKDAVQLDQQNLVSLWTGFVVQFSIRPQDVDGRSPFPVRQAIRTASETATVEDACTLIYHHLGIDLAVRSPSRFRCEFRQERFPPASPTQGASVAGGPPGLYPLDPQTRLIDLSVSSIHRPIVVELITQTPQDREGVSELFRAFEKARNPLVSWIFPQSRLSFELWIYTGTKRFGVRDLSPLGESKAKTVVTLLIENPMEPVQSILAHFVSMFPQNIQKCFAAEGGPILKMKTSDVVTRPSRRLNQYAEGLDANWLIDPRLTAQYLPTTKFRFTLSTKKERQMRFRRKSSRLAQTRCLTQLDSASKDFLRQSILEEGRKEIPVFIEKGVTLQLHSIKTSKPVAHIKVVGKHVHTATLLDLMAALRKRLEEATSKCLAQGSLELRWLDLKRSTGKSRRRGGVGGATWNAFPIGSGVNTLRFLAQQQWNSLYAYAFSFIGVQLRAQRRKSFLLNRWLPLSLGGSRNEPWDCLKRDALFASSQKTSNFSVLVRLDK